MSSFAIKYDSNDFLVVRALSYCKLGMHQTVQRHTPNLTERIGNAMITALKYLPNCMWTAASELGLTTNAYLFLPFLFGKEGPLLPSPSLVILQTAACCYSTMVALGYTLRAVGRYTNPELMADFYAPSPAILIQKTSLV